MRLHYFVVKDHNLLAINSNKDLDKTSNPDPCKQAQEIIISVAATRGVLEKICSQKFCKFHRKTPVPESLFK